MLTPCSVPSDPKHAAIWGAMVSYDYPVYRIGKSGFLRLTVCVSGLRCFLCSTRAPRRGAMTKVPKNHERR